MAIVHVIYDEQGNLISVTRTEGGRLDKVLVAKDLLEIVREGPRALNPIKVVNEQAVIDGALLKLRFGSDHLTEEEKREFREILLTTNVITDTVHGTIRSGAGDTFRQMFDVPAITTYQPITRVVDP